MQITDKLTRLREEMKKEGITYYYIPTADDHESEYVGEHYKVRAYMSGFTGSSGILLVSLSEAFLWTDGRYFIQAESQLADSGIKLMKSGEPDVPTCFELLREKWGAKDCLGFDGRVVNAKDGKELMEICGTIHCNDLVARFWHDRPSISKEPIYLLDTCYSGETFASKKSRLFQIYQKGDWLIESSLDAIGWLLNIRGNDVFASPVVLSFVVINEEKTIWFVDEQKLTPIVRSYCEENEIEIMPYEQFYSFLAELQSYRIHLNSAVLNHSAYEAVSAHNTIIDEESVIMKLKAIKNETEQENLRIAHLRDGIAVTKFMYYIKQQVGKEEISEISADEYLTNLRSQQEHFISPSFHTIAACKEHAAMMHYSADETSNYKLEPDGMFLVDSGGQYFEGTTDITRTFILGEITDEMKRDYTLVLKGVIALSKQKFLYGCSGINLDIMARQYLWNQGIDYRCGTGHGVGYLLNVHEGPHGIRWRQTAVGSELRCLEKGMVVTNEPGVYNEGKYGIRIENELLIQNDLFNEYGQFMKFETITYAPIDLDGVDVTLLTAEERDWLNAYHALVYEKLERFLDSKERDWLKQYTRSI